MSLNRAKVDEVAFLARLDIPEAERDTLTTELQGILGFCEQLSELETDGVEPMTSVVEANAPMRDDVITSKPIPERVLANAPDRVQDFYAVPKVVE